ncbi:MAG: response regulator transcription factor [Planctomycetota bacterium]
MKKKRNAKRRRAKILIVDDQPIVRIGLVHLLNGEPDLEVCGEVGDASEVFEAIELFHPNAVIVALPLNAGICLHLIKTIHKRVPRLPILVFSAHNEAFFAERSLAAGAKGYILKTETPGRIVEAVRRILNGDLGLSNDLAERMLAKLVTARHEESFSGIDRLSDREYEVFHLVGQGFGTRQIAQRLYLSVKTIESHLAHIKKKLNLKDTSELRQQATQFVRLFPKLSGTEEPDEG